jgi:hypothetical protein
MRERLLMASGQVKIARIRRNGERRFRKAKITQINEWERATERRFVINKAETNAPA